MAWHELNQRNSLNVAFCTPSKATETRKAETYNNKNKTREWFVCNWGPQQRPGQGKSEVWQRVRGSDKQSKVHGAAERRHQYIGKSEYKKIPSLVSEKKCYETQSKAMF